MIGNDYDIPVMYQDLGKYSMNPFGMPMGGMMPGMYGIGSTSYLGGVTMAPQLEHDKVELINRKNKEGNKTFKTVEFWLEQFNQFNQLKNKVIYLIGNKCDDEDNRIIDLDDAKYFAKEYKLKYYETSAKTGKNIKKLFEDLTIELMDLYPDQRISNFHLKSKNAKKKDKFC